MFEAVVLIVTPELTQNEFDALLPLVSQEKQDRIKKFRCFQDAQNCLLGDILARVEICRATGLNCRQIDFSLNPYGKPFLTNSPHIHFNTSHAGHYIACAVANTPVGIDIELMRPIDLKIAQRFFATDEIKYVMDSDQLDRFYEIWTKKESYVKFDGQGLYKPLFSFSIFDPAERLFYHKIFENEEAICHACSTTQDKPFVRVMDTAMLLCSIYNNNLLCNSDLAVAFRKDPNA